MNRDVNVLITKLANQIQEPIKKVIHHGQDGCIPEARLIQHMQINNCNTMANQTQGQKSQIIHVVAKQAFDKAPHLLQTKAPEKAGTEGTQLSKIKAAWGKCTPTFCGKAGSISFKAKREMSVLAAPVRCFALARTVRKEKETKGTQIGKEINVSLAAGGKTLHLTGSKGTTRKLLEWAHTFSKATQ